MNEQKIISSFLLAVLIAILAIIGLKIDPAMIPFEAILFYGTAFCLLYCLVFNPQELPLPKVLQSGVFIIIAGILLRLMFLAYPVSDEVNRYAWEGLVQNAGVNPYLTAPAELKEKYIRDMIYWGINNPDIAAIRPPVALLTFRLISSVHYSLVSYKVFFLICDMLTLVCLWGLLRQWKLEARLLMLYAFNPLVLLYGVGDAHVNVLMVLYLAVALLCFNHSESSGKKWFAALAYLALGLAVMVSFLSLILLPFLMTRKNARFSWAFLLPLVSYLWFIDPGMFNGLWTFLWQMSYNGFFMNPLIQIFGNTWARIADMVICLGGVTLIWLFFQEKPRERGMLYAFFWSLLCLPTFYPCYLIPLAVLMLRWPSRSILLLMLTAGFDFFVRHNLLATGIGREFLWLWPATYLPPVVFLLCDRMGAQLPWQRTYRKINSCDIVIPVLNEAGNLEKLLSSLNNAIEYCDHQRCMFRSAFSIVFVDGGSSDDTVDLLNASGLGRIVLSGGGRGRQFAVGIGQGDGDLIVMLHAGTRLDETAFARLLAKLNQKPHVAWGVMQHCYDTADVRMGLVQMVNVLRFRGFGIALGDQGIFIKRDALEAVGGMPEIPLMEDVELSQKMSLFPAAATSPALTISSRHWKEKSFTKYSLQVFWLILYYLFRKRLGYDIDKTARKIYQRYYGRPATGSIRTSSRR